MSEICRRSQLSRKPNRYWRPPTQPSARAPTPRVGCRIRNDRRLGTQRFCFATTSSAFAAIRWRWMAR